MALVYIDRWLFDGFPHIGSKKTKNNIRLSEDYKSINSNLWVRTSQGKRARKICNKYWGRGGFPWSESEISESTPLVFTLSEVLWNLTRNFSILLQYKLPILKYFGFPRHQTPPSSTFEHIFFDKP